MSTGPEHSGEERGPARSSARILLEAGARWVASTAQPRWAWWTVVGVLVMLFAILGFIAGYLAALGPVHAALAQLSADQAAVNAHRPRVVQWNVWVAGTGLVVGIALGWRLKRTPRPMPAMPTPAAMPLAPETPPMPVRSRRSRSWLWTVVVLALLFAAGYWLAPVLPYVFHLPRG